jgi:hypothetical protein
VRSLAKVLLAFLFFSTGYGHAAGEDGRSLRTQLIGHWTLLSLEVVSGEAIQYPLGRDVSGLIVYDGAGHMAVQIMRANRPRFASGDQASGTFAELTAAVGGYIAYFGSYSVDEGARVVTHHLTGSLFPNWVGTEQQRAIVLQGDQLTLSSQPIPFQGETRVFRIVWKRQE